MGKKILILLIVFSVILTGCSSNSNTASPTPTTTETSADKTFTLEELAKYDGQNGNPAYVAVDGVVYDVSNAKNWNKGVHKNGVTAGKDLTNRIGSSPHGKSVLSKLPIVGKLK